LATIAASGVAACGALAAIPTVSSVPTEAASLPIFEGQRIFLVGNRSSRGEIITELRLDCRIELHLT
jgi:hypothetical protein